MKEDKVYDFDNCTRKGSSKPQNPSKDTSRVLLPITVYTHVSLPEEDRIALTKPKYNTQQGHLKQTPETNEQASGRAPKSVSGAELERLRSSALAEDSGQRLLRKMLAEASCYMWSSGAYHTKEKHSAKAALKSCQQPFTMLYLSSLRALLVELRPGVSKLYQGLAWLLTNFSLAPWRVLLPPNRLISTSWNKLVLLRVSKLYTKV